MIAPAETEPNMSGWEVPEFEAQIYAPRRNIYALVIPVINEGERIRAQIARTSALDFPVDIVIADGGSTDGSLDPQFVSDKVRAVLVKTGPGKLSAQLRLAYSWALQEGYQGIVTVDGNGKDGVAAIADMVSKLRDGYDYVQGSRYAPGGLAENTPLERTVANRCVHAPLLSLAGRHWLSDTTNGFRAYSRRYLLDSRVAPFRDIFMRYELLFYLTVRAGQLGYRVTEIGVERRYPADIPPPTKISGLSGKLDVLRQTFGAALGRYHPRDT